MTHELKCWPVYFQAITDGNKMFEIRKDDRPFALGDTLHLREWKPPHDWEPVVGEYTGRELFVRVTYLIKGGPFRVPGHAVMSIRYLDCQDCGETATHVTSDGVPLCDGDWAELLRYGKDEA